MVPQQRLQRIFAQGLSGDAIMKIRKYVLPAPALFFAVTCVLAQNPTGKNPVDSAPGAKQKGLQQGGFKGGFGGGPGTGKATAAERIKVAKDFKVELIYTVPR